MCPAGHNTLVLRSAFPGSKSPRYSCTNSVQCFDTIVQPFALHTLTGSNKIILNRIHPVFSGLHHPTKGGTPYFPSRWSPQPIATQLPPSAPRNSPIRQQGRLSPCPATLRLLPQSTAIESQSSHSMCFFFPQGLWRRGAITPITKSRNPRSHEVTSHTGPRLRRTSTPTPLAVAGVETRPGGEKGGTLQQQEGFARLAAIRGLQSPSCVRLEAMHL